MITKQSILKKHVERRGGVSIFHSKWSMTAAEHSFLNIDTSHCSGNP